MAKKGSGLWAEFKAFISRGNVLDMAVGVVIGGAFSAIVTAVVNILMSVCTWGVPGGIAGLVTVLPALTDAQKGIEGIGQSFAAANISDMTIAYAASQGATITVNEWVYDVLDGGQYFISSTNGTGILSSDLSNTFDIDFNSDDDCWIFEKAYLGDNTYFIKNSDNKYVNYSRDVDGSGTEKDPYLIK